MKIKTLDEALQALVGIPLISACFVEDYLQLDWGCGRLNAYTMPTLLEGERRTGSEDPHYQHAISGLVGRKIRSVLVITHDHVEFDFGQSTTLRISLREEDYTCPEALLYDRVRGGTWVV